MFKRIALAVAALDLATLAGLGYAEGNLEIAAVAASSLAVMLFAAVLAKHPRVGG